MEDPDQGIGELVAHLNDVGSHLAVEHDVKTENFKARRGLNVVGEAGPIVVTQHWQSRHQHLEDHIVNVSPDLQRPQTTDRISATEAPSNVNILHSLAS